MHIRLGLVLAVWCATVASASAGPGPSVDRTQILDLTPMKRVPVVVYRTTPDLAVADLWPALDVARDVLAMASVDNPRNDLAALKRQHEINFSGVVAAIRAAVDVMAEDGRIVTVGCGVNTRVGFPALADYTATKAAVIGYSKGAARDLAARNITINVVQRGFVETDMNTTNGAYASAFKATTAFGRYARPEEIAAAIVFLASPEASYITGTVLNVDGGYGA